MPDNIKKDIVGIPFNKNDMDNRKWQFFVKD